MNGLPELMLQNEAGLFSILKIIDENFGPQDQREGLELFLAYRNGQITKQQYLKMNSFITQSTSMKLEPKRYPEMPAYISDYVQSRLNGQAERNEENSRYLFKIGVYAQEVFQYNYSEYNHMVWAYEILSANEDCQSAVIALKSKIDLFQRYAKPLFWMRDANQVMLMDSKIREKKV